jgi:DNA-binding NarL/FixJ family response regulator
MADSPSSRAKHVALVGHCGPDSSFLRMAISSAVPGAKISMADTEQELEDVLSNDPDLLLFNRVLEDGFADRDGVSLLKRVKTERAEQKVMMVSNYAETQEEAEAAGAVPGFGKADLGSEKAKERIAGAVA